MIREALQGLGLVAYGDPPPSAGVPRGMSYSPSTQIGRIRLVPSKGRAREATYQQVYYANPFVYAATNFVARGIGRLPLHLYTKAANGEKRQLESDLAGASFTGGVELDALLNEPQGRLSRAAMYSGTIRQRLILGNALWQIVRRGAGAPVGLRRIPWGLVAHVEEDSFGDALYYAIRDPRTNRTETLAPGDVIHFGLGSEADQACGVSLLESCSATLALHEALLRHVNAYFENSARPSGHFKVERVNREKAAEIRQLMTDLYASPENAGKILVSTGDWQPMGDSPDHAQIVELLKQSRLEIAAAFQVPPPVLGLLENAIRSNVKELREQFGRDTLGPWATEVEDELEAQLIKPLYPNVYCKLQLAEQLRPDLEARALVYQRMMWVMSIDEIRDMEDLPRLNIPGVTNIPWVASGAMPVTKASQQAPRVPPPPTPPASLADAAAIMSLADAIAEARNGNGHRHEEVPA